MNYILETLEHSSIISAIRDTAWVLSAVEITHLLGVIILVGASLVFDLRLLGYYSRISTYHAYCFILPIAKRGMWLLVPSGIVLFLTQANSLLANPLFWLKIGLLMMACVNLWIFHRLIVPSSFGRQGAEELPKGSEMSALVSLGCWLAIIICGKLL